MRYSSRDVAGAKGALVIDLKTCKNACVFCSNLKGTPSDEELLTISARLSEDIADLKAQGVRKVEISGQDPIEYPAIAELIAQLKTQDFDHVELLSHGRNLADPLLVKKLSAAGLDELRLPIYGASPRIHDAVTRSQGSFAELLRGLNNVKALAPSVAVVLTTMVLADNHSSLLETIRLMCQFSKALTVTVPFPKGYIPHQQWLARFSDFRKQLLLSKKYCQENGVYLHFLDIPYCVFGYAAPYIQNYGSQPFMPPQWLPPKPDRAANDAQLPAYRKKVKLKECASCRCDAFCDGFSAGYVELFGKEEFRPF